MHNYYAKIAIIRSVYLILLLYLSCSATLKQSPSHQSIFTLTLNETLYFLFRYSPLQHVLVQMDMMKQWTEGVSGYTFSRPSVFDCIQYARGRLGRYYKIQVCHVPLSIQYHLIQQSVHLRCPKHALQMLQHPVLGWTILDCQFLMPAHMPLAHPPNASLFRMPCAIEFCSLCCLSIWLH